MQITRTLAVLVVLFTAVTAWLAVSIPDLTKVHVMSGEMAPARLSASGDLPGVAAA